MTPWHASCGTIPFDALAIINELVADVPLPPHKRRTLSYQAECVQLRGEVDRLKYDIDCHKLVIDVANLEPQRQQRQFAYARQQLEAQLAAVEDAKVKLIKGGLHRRSEGAAGGARV